MAARISFWREMFRVWTQWICAGSAVIPAGVALGFMLKHGYGVREARITALFIAVVLGKVFWDLIGRRFFAIRVEYAVLPFSPTIVQFGGNEGAFLPMASVATVVLAVTCYSVQPATIFPSAPALSLTCYTSAVAR